MQLDLIGQSDYFITYSRLILAMLKVYATVLLIGRKCITLIGVLIRHNVDFKHTSALYIASVLLKTYLFFISFNVHMTFSHCICCHMPRSGICSYQLENERSFFLIIQTFCFFRSMCCMLQKELYEIITIKASLRFRILRRASVLLHIVKF